ncbi:a-factor receptor [Serendipita sp. 400]|nr:a-factor receptor [Serendipita sp. 400]
MTFKNFSYLFPGYPIFCIISALLSIIPIPSHYRAGNIAIIAIGLWSFGGNVIAATNTIVWHGNLRNPHPVWGDISQAYFSVMNFGLSSATLHVQYTLWRVARNRKLWMTPRQRRWQKFWAYFFGYGVPILFVVLHYIVQGHRYNVVEDLGPTPTTYLTTMSFAIYYIWDPIFCIIAFVFAILTFITCRRYQKEVTNMFNLSKKHSANEYRRLFLLTGVLVFIHFPFTFWVVVVNAVKYDVDPWISWDDTHFDYMRIEYWSRSVVESIDGMAAGWSVSYWAVGLTGYFYFLCYGTGSESLRQYKQAISYVLRHLGFKSKPSTTTITAGVEASVDKVDTKGWSMPFFARRQKQDTGVLSSVGQTGTTTLVPPEGLGDKHTSEDLKGDSAEKLPHNQDQDQDVTVFTPTSMATTGAKDNDKLSGSDREKEKDLEAQKDKWEATAEETEEVGF